MTKPHDIWHLNLVRMVIDHGANIDAEDNEGQTPFHRVLGAQGHSDEELFGY
jgi:ankyrin repeat protein